MNIYGSQGNQGAQGSQGATGLQGSQGQPGLPWGGASALAQLASKLFVAVSTTTPASITIAPIPGPFTESGDSLTPWEGPNFVEDEHGVYHEVLHYVINPITKTEHWLNNQDRAAYELLTPEQKIIYDEPESIQPQLIQTWQQLQGGLNVSPSNPA